MNHSNAHPRAGSSERGITLIELLVVLVVVGLGALLAVENLHGMYRKFELESSAQELAAFLSSVPTMAKQRNQELRLVWDPEAREVKLLDQTGGEVRKLTLKDYLVVEPSSAQTFRCDTMGRTYSGTAVTMMGNVQMISATHEQMVSGDISPRITYQLSLSPLWNITVAKVSS